MSVKFINKAMLTPDPTVKSLECRDPSQALKWHNIQLIVNVNVGIFNCF